ncbi:MAG: hypothetical protein ACREDL_07040, partial [Bradyrhizobium sp.]
HGHRYGRYRHRYGRYHYFRHGWWYAFPWWTTGYGSYGYWSHVCARRWGYRTHRYYRCMRHHGFY